MDHRLRQFQTARMFVFGAAATLTLIWLPSTAHAQSTSTATQDRQTTATQPTGTSSTAAQSTTQPRTAVPGDDPMRTDVARFDQFLDTHHEIAVELRRTPSLIDDPQFLQNHPELNTYLQDHPSVKQEISQRPDTFMRLENAYDRDTAGRDRDAGIAERDRGINGQDRGADRRDVSNSGGNGFDRFLDQHREIAEQVRKDPSLVNNRSFVESHPALQTYLQQNPGDRDQLRQNPNTFMQQQNADNLRDRDAAAGPDRDAFRGNGADFGRFMQEHREIAEQVRKNPSLVDDRNFVQGHPELQTYLQQNPGVRDQLRQNPNGFVQQADLANRDAGMRDRDPMHDHMADFGGFLGNHADIQKDLSRNPGVVKDHQYVQNHAELNTYLNAHPDVRSELMANPQNFVQGAQQYNRRTGSPSGAAASGSGAGTGMSSHGTATATGSGAAAITGMNARGTGTAGTSTGTTTTIQPTQPNRVAKPE